MAIVRQKDVGASREGTEVPFKLLGKDDKEYCVVVGFWNAWIGRECGL
jgi:hypothetical protein